MGRLGLVLVLRLGLGLALGLQLRIGIGFRRNHSWSSTFMPRRNHSLCHFCIRSANYVVFVLKFAPEFLQTKRETCTCFCRKTIGELCEDMEVVRSTDSTFGNLEMTFKLNQASILCLLLISHCRS